MCLCSGAVSTKENWQSFCISVREKAMWGREMICSPCVQTGCCITSDVGRLHIMWTSAVLTTNQVSLFEYVLVICVNGLHNCKGQSCFIAENFNLTTASILLFRHKSVERCSAVLHRYNISVQLTVLLWLQLVNTQKVLYYWPGDFCRIGKLFFRSSGLIFSCSILVSHVMLTYVAHDSGEPLRDKHFIFVKPSVNDSIHHC